MLKKEIIGIDHGNRNIKTKNEIFTAAVQPLQTRPDSFENILEYQNRYYQIPQLPFFYSTRAVYRVFIRKNGRFMSFLY